MSDYNLPPPRNQMESEDALLKRGFTPQEVNLIKYHRDSLLNRNGAAPLIHPNGATTTVYARGVKGPDGRIYTVPGYDNQSRQMIGDTMNDQEFYRRWEQDIAANRFPSVEDKLPQGVTDMQQHPANVQARRLHDIIDADMAVYQQSVKPPLPMRKQVTR